MTINKKTKKIISGAAIAFIAVILVLFINMGSVVKSIAENVGSKALGVDVSIGDIDISAVDKAIKVVDVRISNPKGYSEPYAMKIGLINIDAETLSGELLVFKDVTIKGSELFLEVTKEGTNLSSLKSNIDSKPKEKTASAEKASDGKAPKIIIERFLFSETVLHPAVTLLGKASADVKLPDIRLSNIGKSSNKNGADASEVASKIVSSISTVAVQTVAKAGLLKGVSSDALKTISGSIKLPSGLLEGAGEDLNKATDKIKGLFGR